MPAGEDNTESMTDSAMVDRINQLLVEMVTHSSFDKSRPILTTASLKVVYDATEIDSAKSISAESMAFGQGWDTSAIPQDPYEAGFSAQPAPAGGVGFHDSHGRRD